MIWLGGLSLLAAAEDAVVRELGGDPKNIRFTEAIRPRLPESQVNVCVNCQAKYSPDQFPDGTQFDPGGWVAEDVLGER